MRSTSLKLIGAVGIAAVWTGLANAAPAVPNTEFTASSNIVRVEGGCGPGYYLTYWGGCVPYGYGHHGWRHHYHHHWHHHHWRHY